MNEMLSNFLVNRIANNLKLSILNEPDWRKPYLDAIADLPKNDKLSKELTEEMLTIEEARGRC